MSEYYCVSVSEAWNHKFPEQVVMVTTVDNEGIPNSMPAGWCMPSSGKPPMIAVSIGIGQFTADLIKLNGEFVISFPNEEMAEKMLFCGKNSGRDVKDKLKQCGWTTEPAAVVKPPLLSNCLVHFECKLVSITESGDHLMFLGEVVNAQVAVDKKRRMYNFGKGGFSGITVKE